MMCFLLYYVLWLCASSRCRMQSLLLSSPIYPPFHCSRRPCPITRRSAVGRQRRRRRHRGASLVFHWWQRRPAAKIFQRTPPRRAVIPTCLHHLCCHCCPPPKMPLPKLAERDLQEIPRVLPSFRVGAVIVLRCDATAIIALSLLPPNEQHADIDCRHQGCRGWRTRRRRRRHRAPRRRGDQMEEGSRSPGRGGGRRPGGVGGRRCCIRCTPPPLLPPPPLPSRCETSLLPQPSGPSSLMAGAAVPPERPPQ